MVTILKEKIITSKDVNDKFRPSTLKFDLSKVPKISSCCLYEKHGETKDLTFTVFLGLTSGNILGITISKHRNLFKSNDEIVEFPCLEDNKHKGKINSLILVYLNLRPILVSCGIDNTIKIWDPFGAQNKNIYFLKTIKSHHSTVLSLAFVKTKEYLLSASADKTIKVWKFEKFEANIPKFRLIQTINVGERDKKIDGPFWGSSFAIKEDEKIGLYVGDTKGGIHTYEYIHDDEKKIGEFVHLSSKKIHKSTIIQVISSLTSPVVYTTSYDTHLVSYDYISSTKNIDISNINKSYFSSLFINYDSQEIISGDDRGNLNFIKIYDKNLLKIKCSDSPILYIQSISLFQGCENLLVVAEDTLEIIRLKREHKIKKENFHSDKIIKIFVVEPVLKNSLIVEDAKLITASYDNKVKIWDYLSMECISCLDLHYSTLVQSLNKNFEISTVCYLDQQKLLVIGLDIGVVLFWDMNISDFINSNDHSKSFRHKHNVTSIISGSYKKKDKEKEFLFTTGYDGLILVWNIEVIEMKLPKLSSKIDHQSTEMKINDNEFRSKKIEDKIYYIVMYDQEKERKELEEKNKTQKKFKYLPNIKICINTSNLLSGNNNRQKEITCLAFENEKLLLFSGGYDGGIYCWSVETGVLLRKVGYHKNSVTCLKIYNDGLLFSGSEESRIFIWDYSKSNESPVKSIEPLTQDTYSIREILSYPKYGLMLSINSNKTINFFLSDRLKIEKIVNTKEDPLCGVILDSYGRLLCGTKDKTITEIDLKEILEMLKIEHDILKFPFLLKKENFTIELKDTEKPSNFKLMKLITDSCDKI